MNSRVITTLAQMARREPLRSLHRLCESQKQVSTAKLEDYLLCAGDELAGYAEILRDEFNNIAASPAAPAAEGTTSDKYRAELYDEVWQRARDMGYGNVTDALVDLERMKAAAPAQAEQEPVAFTAQTATDGLYAVLFRDNWDGQGDSYHMLARKHDGAWFADENGKYLLKYEGDAILRIWPLDAEATPTTDAALVEALKELVSAVRSINRSRHHQIQLPADSEPVYWQRKEWIDWILGLADSADAALAGKGGE